VQQLVISKRFEFSASHRLHNPRWSEEKNQALFQDSTRGPYGHGHNFVVFFSFTGPVDPNTGMIVELSIIKQKINTDLLNRYDHYYLNDLPSFETQIPAPETIALVLLNDASSVFKTTPYTPVSVHLMETPHSAATAYRDGRITRTYSTPTHSMTVSGPINPEIGSIVLDTVANEWISNPTMTAPEILVRRQFSGDITLETRSDGQQFVEIHAQFTATHRLYRPQLSDDVNQLCFGKCMRPHGHMFEIWATFTDTQPHSVLETHIATQLNQWQYQALDMLPEFDGQLTSIETIIERLWHKLDRPPYHLVRLRFHETPNNRFSIRTLQ
jgi:6-pyruvoyltetrahydropterin/6-carboxytetrahydropterin synthase